MKRKIRPLSVHVIIHMCESILRYHSSYSVCNFFFPIRNSWNLATDKVEDKMKKWSSCLPIQITNC